MKILLVGSGGREHAIAKKIIENKSVEKLYAVPGNGGMADIAECVAIGANDITAITDFAKEKKIDFAVVAPDDPLVLGLVDELNKIGIPCFGPDKKAAIIEGSKVFSKNLMKKYNIPTAYYETFSDVDGAEKYIDSLPEGPVVVKADGLALGKGVILASSRKEAKDAVFSMIHDGKFGASGANVVIEEFLTGPEVSVLAFTDGNTVVPMVSSMDHKRALDGDKGLNTGGMGTIAPNPYYTEDIAKECMDTIFIPTINAMNSEGRTFKGCLYFGLMLTPDGPKVIEYNCRFGDPETQVVLPLLKTDLLEIMIATADGTLDRMNIEWENGSACCIVMASEGYPEKYKKGFEITGINESGADVFVAGASIKDGKLVSSGGRVLGVTQKGKTLKEAIDNAYKAVGNIYFENAFYRKDIGQRALKAE